MSQPKVRFAYVGCGFVAQTIHIPNFRAQADCDFIAVAEVRAELGKSVAARLRDSQGLQEPPGDRRRSRH